ncbi:MAG: pyridoxal 5'-phosphate synthase glutaminase subunit PdxT, partial [Candidatus Levybacteria bacterium]|nr:pyridoxal 5'-phosphate synthase glutaminase subunit PdxT [Candidatus Levybacteria bacterium]
GAIMLAKTINNKTNDQKTLALMDIEINRNAYGRQTESFEKDIDSKIGKMRAVFIRAPKITKIGKNISVLAKNDDEIVACEERRQNSFYLACTFHPELTSTKFHEYFFTNVVK